MLRTSDYETTDSWRCSSVGKSTRFIPVESSVRITATSAKCEANIVDRPRVVGFEVRMAV